MTDVQLLPIPVPSGTTWDSNTLWVHWYGYLGPTPEPGALLRPQMQDGIRSEATYVVLDIAAPPFRSAIPLVHAHRAVRAAGTGGWVPVPEPDVLMPPRPPADYVRADVENILMEANRLGEMDEDAVVALVDYICRYAPRGKDGPR